MPLQSRTWPTGSRVWAGASANDEDSEQAVQVPATV